MSLESPIQEIKRQAPAPYAEKSQAELRAALEKKLLATKPNIDAGIAEYQKALQENLFDDKPGEDEGSGQARQEALQKRLLGMVERAERMRAQLDSGEELQDTPEVDAEGLLQTNESFMQDTFTTWYNQQDAARAKKEVVVISPETQDYKALSEDTNAAEFGTYTLNPETQGLDFEHAKGFVPDLSSFNGKPLHEVIKHVVDTYGGKYHVPGIEYWKWLYENQAKIPQNLKDGNYYFLPGSVLRGGGGEWSVPYGRWDGSEWSRGADWLTRDWYSDYRVVLLEK